MCFKISRSIEVKELGLHYTYDVLASKIVYCPK